MIFEREMLRKIFGPWIDESTRERRRIRITEEIKRIAKYCRKGITLRLEMGCKIRNTNSPWKKDTFRAIEIEAGR